jgi:hypothetical protein
LKINNELNDEKDNLIGAGYNWHKKAGAINACQNRLNGKTLTKG